MALSRTHDLINLTALPLFVYVLPKEATVPFTVGYIVGTFLLSPDLDLPGSRPSRRWSVLRWVWIPYWAFSRHRGISHMPVIGTLIRIAYVVFAVIFLYFSLIGVVSLIDRGLGHLLAGWNPFDTLERVFRSREAVYFVGGVLCADVVHIVLDSLWSLLRRIT
ncbi:MAG: DUF2227 family putative metal-binding protein [Aquificota bacterium]|nr:DUF2227 family putative metal-binding protein [Aquificota bacterium]MDQ7083308.1 DUF2227 family putative metal-binding protein [Aquificota bacterium]